MTQSSACRKRSRSSCDEENSEFTPLSKRINNLHINNSLLASTSNNGDLQLINCQNITDPYYINNGAHQNNLMHHSMDGAGPSSSYDMMNGHNIRVEHNGALVNGINHPMNGSHMQTMYNQIDNGHLEAMYNGHVVSNSRMDDMHNGHIANGHIEAMRNGHMETLHNSHIASNSHIEQSMMQQYNPDLTANENPYYYEKNKLLYTLFMERTQRSNNELL